MTECRTQHGPLPLGQIRLAAAVALFQIRKYSSGILLWYSFCSGEGMSCNYRLFAIRNMRLNT